VGSEAVNRRVLRRLALLAHHHAEEYAGLGAILRR
jgi:hypothetical protein